MASVVIAQPGVSYEAAKVAAQAHDPARKAADLSLAAAEDQAAALDNLYRLIPTTLPVFFLTGATWPREAMPGWVAAVGGLLPATHGARALLLVDQMGAPLAAVLPVLGRLALLGAIYLGLAYIIGTKAIGEPTRPADTR